MFLAVDKADTAKVTSPDRATQHGQPGTDCMEEMDEGVSQNSSKDSTCSPPECDLGDETMASQETAATDVSHLALPMARIVCETLPFPGGPRD